MRVQITALTAPLTEEQMFHLGAEFTQAVNDGTPVTLHVGDTAFPLHPESIDEVDS